MPGDTRTGGTEHGIAIAGVEYMCRVCEDRRIIYINPIHREGRPVVDLESQHRITQYECRDCMEERTHVAVRTLPERYFETGTDRSEGRGN